MNRTLLLPLLSRCLTPLSSTGPVATASTSREAYDNAYCYILFVMVFYSFLATMLFKCIGSDEDEKDPYEEFTSLKSSLRYRSTFPNQHMDI
uniref:Uncharacterized protein n=1 Tax=Mola mola TaxID=94237 RepID=A0A3Q3XLV4_MOLML